MEGKGLQTLLWYEKFWQWGEGSSENCIECYARRRWERVCRSFYRVSGKGRRGLLKGQYLWGGFSEVVERNKGGKRLSRKEKDNVILERRLVSSCAYSWVWRTIEIYWIDSWLWRKMQCLDEVIWRKEQRWGTSKGRFTEIAQPKKWNIEIRSLNWGIWWVWHDDKTYSEMDSLQQDHNKVLL